LLIVTSKEVIYYTPPYREGERGQVAIKRAVDVQSNLAVSLLSGGADIAKNFKVKKIESAHFELKPIKSSGDINKIDLYVEKSTNLVYKVLLSHTTKNTTEIELRNVRLGVELSDSIFRFKIPPNTNKID
jgi:outer membrane lipoprotein-sorting protein